MNGTPCPLRSESNLGSRASFHRKLDFASQTNARLAAFSPKHWEVFVGPRNGHKLTPEVMKFVAEQQTLEPSLSFAQLAELVQHNFHVKVHPRSIERQLLREKKLR